MYLPHFRDCTIASHALLLISAATPLDPYYFPCFREGKEVSSKYENRIQRGISFVIYDPNNPTSLSKFLPIWYCPRIIEPDRDGI